jgi:hypothetical protein
MIAARVANGPAVARAAAAHVPGPSTAAMTSRTTPVAHMIVRRGSLDDAILSDLQMAWRVVSGMMPPRS